ncbi:MAG: hypothetical protein WCY09_08145 [Candidatus Omnitrophota bacterium]
MGKSPTVFQLLSEWAAARAAADSAIAEYDATVAAAREEFVTLQVAAVADAEGKVREHADYKLIATMLGGSNTKSRKSEGDTDVYGLFTPKGEQVVNADGVTVGYVRKCITVAPSLKAIIGDSLEGYSVRHLESGDVLSDSLTWRKDRAA